MTNCSHNQTFITYQMP